MGWGKTEQFFDTRALWWVNGRVVNLQIGSSGISWSSGWGINNVGQIVGFAQEPGGKHRDNGFLWEQGKGMQLLKNLVAPNSGMQIDLAFDINDNGEIAARAYRLNDGFFRALKLVPVDPEMVLSDPVPGVAGVVNSWTVTGAVPGAKVTFVYGFKGGGTRVPGCDVLDAAVQIDGPKVVKTVVADGSGVAT